MDIVKNEIYDLITVIIAITAIIAPVLVAFINNQHQKLMKKIDLEKEEKETAYKQYYSDKKNAYEEFLQIAGAFTPNNNLPNAVPEGLASAASKALIYASADCQIKIKDFVEKSREIARQHYEDPFAEYWHRLSMLAITLDKDLKNTKECYNNF